MFKLQFSDRDKPDMWLVDPVVKIGSDPSCEIILSGPQVAPFHGELRVSNNTIVFQHLSRSHNSFVNQSIVTADIDIGAWDVIKIGDTEMEVVDPLVNRSPKRSTNQASTEALASADWIIQGQSGDTNGQMFPVTTTLTIGRDLECDIVLAKPQVSRHHTQLLLSHHKLVIKDLGSSNGTYVNGSKITEVFLKSGDEIRIEEVCFRAIYTGNLDINADSFDADGEFASQTKTVIKSTRKKKSKSGKSKRSKFPMPDVSEDMAGTINRMPPAYLHGKTKSIRGKTYEVDPKGSPIGRMLGHHLSRDDSSVSARHIEVYKKDRFWRIKNNGAANGLLVNGRMTTHATLVDGDEITAGGIELVFQCDGAKPRELIFGDENNGLNIGNLAIGIALLTVAVIVVLLLVD